MGSVIHRPVSSAVRLGAAISEASAEYTKLIARLGALRKISAQPANFELESRPAINALGEACRVMNSELRKMTARVEALERGN